MIVEISIPNNVKCLLKVDQMVDFDSIFYEDSKKSEVTVSVSKKLRIPSDKIFNYLKKFVGDPVKEGEILAQKKDFITTNTILSEYTGVIKEINHYDGSLIVSASTLQNKQVNAFFKGEVVDIKKNQLKLKLNEAKQFTLKQATHNFGGQTFYLKDLTKPISASQTSNKIMLSESITAYLETKAEALGISGFVMLKNPPQDSDLAKAQLKNIEDFNKILQLNLPYCFIDKQNSKIYFYR